MPNRNIIKQLNNLKDIKAQDDFKKENRAILLNQVYSGNKEASELSFNCLETIFKKIPLDIFKSVPHSAFVGAFVLVLLFGGGFFGLRAAENAKPGDSLYKAKIAGEKTQLVFTFNEKKKVGLGLEFAGNRAKEISLVLDETENEDKKEETVSQLVDDFKKEINGVKTRIGRISKNTENTEIMVDIEEIDSEEENMEVFSANLGREENGIEISSGSESGEVEVVEVDHEEKLLEDEIIISEELNEEASSSPEEEILEQGDPEGIIDEAKELLVGDNYSEILTKMDEAEDAINQVDSGDGQVEIEIQEEVVATGTEEVIEVEEDEVASSSEE
jgi:hypothetical protein